MNEERKYDVGIVGAGIIGLAHAYFAALKGLKVIVIEKSSRAEGASIRNFGLIWPIGQSREKLERAMRSRSTWLKLSEKAGFWVNNNGSLHLGYHEDEIAVMNEFQEQLGSEYKTEFLLPKKLKSTSPFIVDKGLIGGLYSPNELTVNSREALPAITSYLEDELGVTFRFNTQVAHVENGGIDVLNKGNVFNTDRIIVTGGSDIHTLFPNLFEEGHLIRTKLQMMKAESDFEDSRLGPTLCGGLTLTHYKAFESCKSLTVLNDRIEQAYPFLKEHGIHVMVSQNDHGELIIGDSHEYSNVVNPFNDEEIDNAILTYLKQFFDSKNIRIIERWYGVYAKQSKGDTELVMNPLENVMIVNGLGGAGMTLSFGLAQEIINEL